MEDNVSKRLDRLESLFEIQQLASRYARAIDARDIEELTRLFLPTSNFGADGIGAAGTRTFYERVLADFYRSFHQISGHVIDSIGDDEARGTVYCRAEHEVADGWILNLMIYYDRYRRVDERWMFKGRRARYLYVGDALVAPQSVDFNRWPGREGAFEVELPHAHPTWAPYWNVRPNQRDALTRKP